VRADSKIDSGKNRMKRHQNETDRGAPVATDDPQAGLEAAAGTAETGGTDDAAARLAKAEAEAAEMKDAWLRAKAETENVRKQAEASVAKAHKYAVERFAEDLLPVKDALEQTLAGGDVPLETLKSGAALTLKALQASFDRAQVIEVNPVGENFDPHRHQAMQMVDSEQPPNTVVNVFQKGYLINDRVLRPALVTVAKSRTEKN
jgi:molecular chaperone GrpE